MAKIDGTLEYFVKAVLTSLQDSTAPKPPKVAPFITAFAYSALHDLVWKQHELMDVALSKQAVLALTTASFTGISVPVENAEYIGDAQACFIRSFRRVEEMSAGRCDRQV